MQSHERSPVGWHGRDEAGEPSRTGLFSAPGLLRLWGVVQSAIGGLMIVGLLRRWVYPAVIIINGASMLGVWRSIVDPWGWVLEGTNVLFFPSLIIFAASLLLWAFRGYAHLKAD